MMNMKHSDMTYFKTWYLLGNYTQSKLIETSKSKPDISNGVFNTRNNNP